MTKFIEKLQQRSSVRDFTTDKISDRDWQKIVDVINNAPSSFNMQQFSALIITKPEDKIFINKFLFGRNHIRESAAFILFIADRTRLNYLLTKHNWKNTASIRHHEFVRMITDAVIAATQTHDALLDLGYGITFVGSILPFIDEINQYFQIPDSAFPVVGLSIGKPALINPVKPKMNKVFFHKYDAQAAIGELERYNRDSTHYFLNMPDQKTFIDNTLAIFQNKKWCQQVQISSQKFAKYLQKIK